MISEEELNEKKAPFEAKGVEFVSYPKSTDEKVLIEEAKDAWMNGNQKNIIL